MTYWGSGVIAPRINLGARWKWLVTFTPRPLYPRRYNHWIGGWLGPGSSLGHKSVRRWVNQSVSEPFSYVVNSLTGHQSSQDSSVNMVTRLRAGRPGFDSRLGKVFLYRHRVHISSGAHPAFSPMSNGGCFLGDKAAETWNWPLTSI
jgi:hypothetical protein